MPRGIAKKEVCCMSYKIAGCWASFGMEIIRPMHDGPLEQSFVPKESFVWKVVCPVHGPHEVRQKTEPVSCKIKVQLSPRMVRECRKRLASAVRI